MTLVELLIVVSILSIIVVLSLPDLRKLVHTHKVDVIHTELLSALGFTRSAAISRGKTITLCNKKPYVDECDRGNKSWRYGWVVYSDDNENKQIDSGEEILLIYQNTQPSIFINFNKSYIRYKNLGFASGYAGTFSVCNSNDTSISKQVVVSFNGRVRTVTTVNNLVCRE